MDNDKLTQAVNALRETPLKLDVQSRGERAISTRLERRSRPALFWATGLGLTVLASMILFLAPTKASATELLRVVGNADRGLRRIRNYRLAPGGGWKLSEELVVEGGQCRMLDAESGERLLYDGRTLTRLSQTGETTRRREPLPEMMRWPSSARESLKTNLSGRNLRISLQRGRFFRYTVDRDVLDGRGDLLHNRFSFVVDPLTDRPLQMRSQLTGFPEWLTTWEYPTASASLFRLPTPGPVYDLDAQRASVLEALDGEGNAQTVEGVRVEFLQLWVDGWGQAKAIARADYAYPENGGLCLVGMPTEPFSEAEGRYAEHRPTLYEGRTTQVFSLSRRSNAGRRHYPDRMTVGLPVFRAGRLLGYATFKNVPVHRTQNVAFFLEPANVPFWAEPVSKD